MAFSQPNHVVQTHVKAAPFSPPNAACFEFLSPTNSQESNHAEIKNSSRASFRST